VDENLSSGPVAASPPDHPGPQGPQGHPGVIHLAQCRLVVVKGAQRGREYVGSADVIRVGKAHDNDLVLADETVSRVHLEIVRDQKGYLLRDLHSTNGTFLEGAEIREAYARPGSIITVGAVQLRFQSFEERIEIRPSAADELGELYGRSQAMREIFGLIERLGPTEATFLIEGEPGTGKDLVARTIHERSRRQGGPLIVVDCRALAGHALERTLVGHDKGAFPGATTARQGAFEQAHGGTLLLDHVEDLSLDLQPRLLHVLEQREVRRLGGSRAVKVDVRCIAASERDLRREVERGKFREELYFRLAVVLLRVAPLRERSEDIPGLVLRFARGRGEGADAGEGLDEATLAAIARHDWPGNVRELRSVIDQRMGRMLGTATRDTGALTMPPRSETMDFDPALSYRDTKQRWEHDFERRYLSWLLERSGGNISRASREAEMDRKYLHKLLRRHQLIE
jgi:DNA-binding NtrC family response regulator